MNTLTEIVIICVIGLCYSPDILRAEACSALPNSVLPDMSKFAHRKIINITAIHQIEMLSEYANLKDPEFKRFVKRNLLPPVLLIMEPYSILSDNLKNSNMDSAQKQETFIQELIKAIKESRKNGGLKGKVIKIRKIKKKRKENDECFNEERIYGDPRGKSFHDSSITFTLPMNQSDIIFCLNYCKYPCLLINFNRQNKQCSLISQPMALNPNTYKETMSLRIKCSIQKPDMKPKPLQCFFPGHQIAGIFVPPLSRKTTDSIHCQKRMPQ
ncbi:unnamed protein product [Lepeophtheirus salmonis]|uniref:(salmon louse) hypothetical protein n=1 Tax=Lepeophtheirus salmonis TaxID=72036 RepID=A0A7R8H7R1_LEPSM|nr:unnamed protein product [Lepeophtheirus salmonis]CAF2915640.1 unnamed protein product [Lepeophtheirus salmonis]